MFHLQWKTFEEFTFIFSMILVQKLPNHYHSPIWWPLWIFGTHLVQILWKWSFYMIISYRTVHDILGKVISLNSLIMKHLFTQNFIVNTLLNLISYTWRLPTMNTFRSLLWTFERPSEDFYTVSVLYCHSSSFCHKLQKFDNEFMCT